MTPPLRRAHCAVSQNGVAHCANPIVRVMHFYTGPDAEAVRAAVEGKDVEMEG